MEGEGDRALCRPLLNIQDMVGVSGGKEKKNYGKVSNDSDVFLWKNRAKPLLGTRSQRGSKRQVQHT